MLSFYKNCSLILRTHEEGEYTSKFEHIDGQNYRTRIIFDARDDEHFYGLGQEQQENFDKKYCSFDLKHWNTKSSLPFVYSSLGYGFLWNNPGIGRAEFAKNHTIWSGRKLLSGRLSCYRRKNACRGHERLCKSDRLCSGNARLGGRLLAVQIKI